MHKFQLKSILFFTLLVLVKIAFAQELTTQSQRAIRLFEEGRSNFNLKYFDLAEDALQKAIVADDHFIEARLLLADVYKSTDRPGEALGVYRDVIAINDSTYPEVYFFAGLLNFKGQQYGQAIMHLEKFMDKNLAGRTGGTTPGFTRPALFSQRMPLPILLIFHRKISGRA